MDKFDEFSLIIIAHTASPPVAVTFSATEDGTSADRPQIVITYADPSPKTPKLSVSWDKDKQATKFNVDIPDEQDWVDIKIRRDSSSSVAYNDGSAQKVDYDGARDTDTITNRNADPITANYDTLARETDGTTYYVRGFSEDANSTDADSTPTNEVSYQ